MNEKLITEQIWPKLYTLDLLTIDIKKESSISDLLAKKP
jgi:hypothetical protein